MIKAEKDRWLRPKVREAIKEVTLIRTNIQEPMRKVVLVLMEKTLFLYRKDASENYPFERANISVEIVHIKSTSLRFVVTQSRYIDHDSPSFLASGHFLSFSHHKNSFRRHP